MFQLAFGNPACSLLCHRLNVNTSVTGAHARDPGERLLLPPRPQARILLLWLPIQSSSLGRNQMSDFHATSAQLRTQRSRVYDKTQLLQLEMSLAAIVQNSKKLNTQELKVILPPSPTRATATGGLAQCFMAWAWESEDKSVTRGTANCMTLGNLTSLCFSFLNGTTGNEILCPVIVV